VKHLIATAAAGLVRSLAKNPAHSIQRRLDNGPAWNSHASPSRPAVTNRYWCETSHRYCMPTLECPVPIDTTELAPADPARAAEQSISEVVRMAFPVP
jgi:hypothetical protein